MTDLIKRDDALRIVEEYDVLHDHIKALPTIDPAAIRKAAMLDAGYETSAIDPAAIREAALREAADVAQRGADIFGGRMRDAKDKKEKRDWQSMLFAAVEIKHAILNLIGETK